MKYRPWTYILNTVLLAALLIACQQEFENVTPIDEEQSFTAESLSLELLGAVTMLDGSSDNILDGASCLLIRLPVSLSIADQHIEVTTTEDFIVVQTALQSARLTSDHINYDYPLTFTTWDYQTITVINDDEWEDWVDQCENDGSDDDIECIDINYPITASTYNPNTELANTYTFNDDRGLHLFLAQLADEIILSFKYPITLLTSTDNTIEINSNTALETTIISFADSCNESDELFIPSPDTLFQSALAGIDWEISLYFDEQDLTSVYQGSWLDFTIDGLISVKGTINASGSWQSYIEDGILLLSIEFEENELMEELSEDWVVSSYSADRLVLQDENNERQLILSEMSSEPSDILSNLLREKTNWEIASYFTGEEDETSEYIGINLRFDQNGSLILSTTDESTYTGSWMTQGDDFLAISFGGDDWDALSYNWTVQEFSEIAVILTFNDDSSQSGEEIKRLTIKPL